jgi:hypothetical protein
VLFIALEQLAATHTVVESYLWQAPAPSQVPSLPQVEGAEAEQSLCGSLPRSAGTHWPSVVVPPQVMHVPVQALSQQTPSTQKPLWQSSAPVHVVPFVSCGMHAPFEQK